MPKTLTLLDQTFPSLKAAKEFFYALRDRHIASGTDIVNGREFDLLRALCSANCDTPKWKMPSEPVSFYVRYIARGVGDKGGSTEGFVVRFKKEREGQELEREFSVRKAITYVAGRQNKD